MTGNEDQGTGAGNGREQNRSPEPDPVGSVLGMVDEVQRKIFSAGVRRGMDSVVPDRSGGQEDVWGEAVRLEDPQPKPPVEEVLDIVRRSAPEVAGHLGRAGLSLADALGRTWGVFERSMEQARAEARAAQEQADRPADNGPQSGGPRGNA